VRIWRRGRHLATPVSPIEKPSRSPVLVQRITSPWAVIGLYVMNIVILVLIMMLFGVQSQFSDYLNARGQYANRYRQEQHQYICELIHQLRDGNDHQLQELAVRLKCPNGPLPPASSAPFSTSPVPIGPGSSAFTSPPGRSSENATADGTDSVAGGNRALGTKDPAVTAAPARPSPTKTGAG
jgi:hypothetical protein